MVRTLVRLGVAASVCTVEADQAIVIAARAPLGAVTQRLLPSSARLMGIRLPIDLFPWLSRPVRLRRPYSGPATGLETLDTLTSDNEPVRALPRSSAAIQVVGVPAMVHDQVVAVIHVWGAASLQGLVPTLEAAAAMLVAVWETESRTGARRFSLGTTMRASPRLRSEVAALLGDGLIATALQPVVRLLDQSIVGYEALTRFSPRALFSTPDELFAAASALHMEKAVDLTAKNLPAPMGTELGRVTREVQLGLPMNEALSRMVRRNESEDLRLLLIAVQIRSQVGGNLAHILDTIEFTVRERVRIKGEIKSLTGQACAQGWVLIAMPFGMAGILMMIAPSYFDPMIQKTAGQVMLGLAGFLILCGYGLIRRLVNIKI